MRTVLVVDDDADLCALVEVRLRQRGLRAVICRSGAEALERLGAAAGPKFDAVLSDLAMPDMDGIQLSQQIKRLRPELPTVLMTAHGSLDVALSAFRAGVRDFVAKPLDFDELRAALERVWAPPRGAAETTGRAVDALVGGSAPMARVRTLLARLGPLEAPILLTGESGTGKSLVARALHELSPRRQGFVTVNCAAIPEPLLESELFGHVRGAFTDARTTRLGLFAQADGGTLFLDEIGELPLSLQPKLLRALQERRVRPVGSNEEVACNVRIVTATNRDLAAAVERGTFREDLYYRINVLSVELPPLRARGDDVVALARALVPEHAAAFGTPARRLTPAAEAALRAHGWPGNIRELHNAIARATALCVGEEVQADDLPEAVRRARREEPTGARDEQPTMETLRPLREVEERYIDHVLDLCAGNKTRAAEILGVDRRTLARRRPRGPHDQGPLARAARGS